MVCRSAAHSTCWTTARLPPRCAPADQRDGRIESSHDD
jgi:hypothetical protein